MSCCQNPTNLGCYCSCDTVTVESITGKVANEVYISFDFNGANRKILVTEVSATGQPMLDLSGMSFNEDWYYTFGVYDRATSDLLGCFKIKVSPCAGDVFDIPALPPVANYLNSEIIFGDDTCNGETLLPFIVDIADIQVVALIDGTIINLSFSSLIPTVQQTLYSNDANLIVISPTQVQIVSAAAVTSIALGVKLSNCVTNTVTGVVTSFTNLAATWGNGTHTADSKTVNN